MADNRTEIALETINHITTLLLNDQGLPGSTGNQKHAAAIAIIDIYKSAIELTAPPKAGRPRKAKGEAQT
jgi:hypothetical protein